MESLNNILKKSLNKEFLSAIISNPREKGGIVKIKIRPVEHKDNILYQCEEHRNNQVFHHNLNEEEAAGYILKMPCRNSNRCRWRRENSAIRFWSAKKGK